MLHRLHAVGTIAVDNSLLSLPQLRYTFNAVSDEAQCSILLVIIVLSILFQGDTHGGLQSCKKIIITLFVT